MLQYLVKTIFNNFKRNVLITIINILGLALSFTIAFIIIGHIQNQFKFDQNVENVDRIYRLETNWASMPPFIGHVLTQDLSLYKTTRLNFKEEYAISYNKNEQLLLNQIVFADSTFFDVLPFELIKGSKEGLKYPLQIYLTEKEAQQIFGEKNPIGEPVLINNEYTFSVAGIIKNIKHSHLKFDAVLSMVSVRKMTTNAEVLEEFDGWDFPTYILAPENVSKKQAEEAINECLFQFDYKYFIKRFKLRDYDDIYFATDLSNEAGTIHGNMKANKILMLISIFIIVLAIINYINLTTANAYKRYKWIGVNRIVGATKNRIITQFLLETIVICVISLWFSVLFLELINPYLDRFFSVHLILPELYSLKSIAAITLGIVILGLISGIYPAYTLSKYLPVYLIRKYKIGINKKLKLRDILTVIQFVIAIVLITSTLIIYKQFQFVSKSDLGFKPEHVIVLRTNKELEKELDVLKESLLKHPEIKSVSYTLRIPGNEWGSWCCTKIEGEENNYFNSYSDSDEEGHKYFNLAADPDFLTTFNIKLKAGRNFDWNKIADYNKAYIINEAAVKQYGIEDPIGKQVTNTGNGIDGQIIGLVEDFHFRGFHHKVDPVMIYWDTRYLRYANILIDGNSVDNSLLIIKETWEKLYPAFPFKYTFLDDKFDQQYKSDKIFGRLVGTFSIIACFIAGIGILGFSFFYLNQQVKNIGIRKVHGANSWLILRELITSIAYRIIISFIIAVPIIYYAMNTWLKGFAYKIEITIWPFIFGGAITLLFALSTVLWQTQRTARKNPVESLRYE